MSAVVSRGLLFKTASLQKINATMLDWRKWIAERTLGMEAKWFARKTIRVFDHNTLIAAGLRRGEVIKHPMAHVSQEWNTKHENLKRGRREPDVDFEFKVAVIPITSRRVIGKIFTEQSSWADIFMEKYADVVRDYSYWDTSDPDPNVSPREWAQRERDWDLDQIEPHGRFSHCGFMADCTAAEWNRAAPGDAMNHIPSLEKRINTQAQIITRDKRLAVYPKNDRFGDHSFGIVMEINDWLSTPDGRKLQSDVEAEMRAVLKEEVTLEDLLGFKPGPAQQSRGADTSD